MVANIARGWGPDRIAELIRTWDAQVVRGHKGGEALWVRWARTHVSEQMRSIAPAHAIKDMIGANDFAKCGRIRRSGKIVYDSANVPDTRLDAVMQASINAGAVSGRIELAKLPDGDPSDPLVLWWARCSPWAGPELVSGPQPTDYPAAVGSVGSSVNGVFVTDTRDWTPDMKATANLAASREHARQNGLPNPHQPGKVGAGVVCECVHENCGKDFTHHGAMTETTCCPSCGKQQIPNPAPAG